jgi:hypothetical protein
MATELCPNEGKDWIANNPVAGASVYAFLLAGVSVELADITALTQLSVLQATAEETGTGYARQTVTMGASTDGIMEIPTLGWDTLSATDWSTDVMAWGIATHITAGVALFFWDLSGSRPMNVAGATLDIPALDFFFMNPGE